VSFDDAGALLTLPLYVVLEMPPRGAASDSQIPRSKSTAGPRPLQSSVALRVFIVKPGVPAESSRDRAMPDKHADIHAALAKSPTMSAQKPRSKFMFSEIVHVSEASITGSRAHDGLAQRCSVS
jgi:hypothetical protein